MTDQIGGTFATEHGADIMTTAVFEEYAKDRVFTIRDWVKRYGHGAGAYLARRAGVSVTTVHRASKGEAVTHGEAAIKLSEATEGEVSIRAIIRPDGS